MSKLYPPYLEGTIPAFCDIKEGTVLTVPFSMNRAVSKKEVAGFYLKLKTIQSDKYLITVKTKKFDLERQEAYFDLTNYADKLNIGQFYKIQIAYEESDATNTIGYYSSVGVVKYTSRPAVFIEGLEKNTPNKHSYNYLGCYSQESFDEKDIKDYSEKVYSYNFIIQDKTNNIIADSGWILHNNSKDVNSYESQDEFLYKADFEHNKNYYIKYSIRTNNGLEVSSPKYRIVSRKSIMPDVNTKPIPILNFDNGFVDVHLDGTNYTNEQGIETAVSGSFVLSRRTGNEVWEEVLRFSLMGDQLSKWHWRDFTVEQGKTYEYSIQEYNDYDLYSERIISDEIYVDFEDAFLFDGKRQLRIRFNPKVSSFKTNHLESKIDTIGSKHPFIFRNGNVGYKEFPISGLISYQMDDSNLFGFEEDFVLTENFTREKSEAEHLGEYKVKTTNLIGYNFSAERDFKLEVLDWLNNGQPKLYRSPSEGNYIVRLLNTSLSPEDTVSRLIHTFNSTAYEVAEHNYENLNKYGFISISEPDTLQTRWMTIQLYKKATTSNNAGEQYLELMQHKQATSVYFYDMQPGDIVYINGRSIVIGATGSYFIDNGEIIESIGIPFGVTYYGAVTYSFEDSSKNTFDTIIDVELDDVVAHQFIGHYENILNNIEDLKTKVSNFYYLDLRKRDEVKSYAKWINEEIGYEKENGIICLYRDKDCLSRINSTPENLLISVLNDAYYQNYQRIMDDYHQSLMHIEEYYNAEDEDMIQRAFGAMQFEIIDKYYYQSLAEYEIAYENGDITLEQYYQYEEELYNSVYNTIMEEINAITLEEIQEYIAIMKVNAIANAEEKRDIRITSLVPTYDLKDINFANSNLFEDPYRVYKYELKYVELETSHGLMTSTGFTQVDITEEHFLVADQYLQDRYYIQNELKEYVPAKKYNPLEKYYIKKPYEFYYDPKHPTNIFCSQDTKNRIEQFEKDQLEAVFGPFSGFKVQSYYHVYTNKCIIDGEELDLSDRTNIQINSLTQFKEIRLEDGVVLNCGYEIQLLEYFNEYELEDYQLLKDLRQILNSTWKDTKEEYYLVLLNSTGLINTINNLKKEDETIQIAARKYYYETIMKAHDLYDNAYLRYNNRLTQILREQEVIE